MSLKNIVKLILLTILVLCLENVAYSQAAKQVEEISQPSAKQKDASIVAVNELSDLEGGEWALVDFGDFIVHILQPETRAFYNIEGLWQDRTA